MEPANQSPVKRWFARLSGGSPSRTVVEYLPDADEIERSPPPRYAQFTLQLLVVALIAFFVWSSLSQLDQVVVAQGRLVNPLPNVVVQPLETGVIQSVDVRVGQVVKKGDALATLDATFVQADGEQLKLRMQSLETQIAGIQLELSGGKPPADKPITADGQLQAKLLTERKANYDAQQLKLAETAGRLRASVVTNKQDQQLVLTRLKSLREIEAMQEKMVAQKYSAPLQLLEAQQRTQEVSRELENTKSREFELRRELAAFEAEKTAFEKNWRQKSLEDLLTLTRERDGIEQQLQKAGLRSKLVMLTAPSDAVVLEIAKLSPGSIIREAETFFTLVPLNTTLEVEAQINSGDVGYIKTGMPVHVKLDAYPFQRHGALDATVTGISEDAFKRDPSSKSSGDAYYLARMKLTDTKLRNMAESARFLPGMSLSAEVVVGKRSVISYFAWPLTKGLDEAIREPR